MKKKESKKYSKKRIDPIKLFFARSILSIGILLFFVYYLSYFILNYSFNIYFQITSLGLIYFGLVWHLFLIEKNPLKSSFEFVLESKKYIFFIVGLFFFFVLIGSLIIFAPPELQDRIIEPIFEQFEKIREQTKGMSVSELSLFIILNNTSVGFIGMILGSVLLGFFPLVGLLFLGVPMFLSIYNGYIIGVISGLSVALEGAGTLFLLIPHGVFELPAIFISLGLGLKISYSGIIFIYDFLKNYKKEFPLFASIILLIFFPIVFLFIAVIIDSKLKNYSKNFLINIINSLRAFILVVIPLLIIAGVIEGVLISLI